MRSSEGPPGNLGRRWRTIAWSVSDALERRQAPLLRLVLRTCLVFMLLALPLTLYDTLLLEPRGSSGLTAAAWALACLLGAWTLLRRNLFQRAMRVASVGLVIAVGLPLLHTGLFGGGLLVFAFAIPLILAALLADRRLLFVTAGLILVTVEGIGLLEWYLPTAYPLSAPTPAAYPLLLVGFAMLLLLVSALLLQWGGSFRSALREAVVREQEILETYALLEHTVTVRTAALDEVNHALRQANAELIHLSYRDALTGVANRRQFDMTLTTEWRRATRSQQPLSLLLLDIDDFKHYNDTYGHLAGDACLQQVAQAVQQRVRRSGDLVARYGGEEFAVLLPGSDLASAGALAATLHQAIRDLALPHASSPTANIVTMSVGVATVVPQAGERETTLVAAADAALYAAKRGGRDRWSNVPSPPLT
ncbi:MAG: diguanylate cyclase [Herpetosiphonaceae bacterium]|nr:diguanylate cyclase [Herpetosiphonaceae bacterium]